MKLKVFDIKGCDHCEQVCVQLVRNDEYGDHVRVSAWHKHEDGDLYQSSIITFDDFNNSLLAAERFIADFSEVSANEFANSFVF